MPSERSPSEVPDPPETERRPITEELHGHEVTDPYRWLEGDDEEVKAWVQAQNEYADRLLDTPTREALRPRMESLGETETHFPVRIAGGVYFQRVEPAGADHPVLHVRRGRDADPDVLVDPNEWPEGRSMDWYVPSTDGELVAYGAAEGGTEQYDVVVINLDGEEVDRIDDVGRATVDWYDGGFYYRRTGGAGEGGPGGGQLDKELRRHDLNGADEVLADEFAPDVRPRFDAAEDGRLAVTFDEWPVRSDLYVYAPGDDDLLVAHHHRDAVSELSVYDPGTGPDDE